MISIGFGACDNTLEPRIGPDRLVVEGWVTDRSGPFEVKLTTTAQFASLGGFPKVSGAAVAIVDDLGETYSLSNEVEPGIYQTQSDSLQGALGRSYVLLIELPNGKQYQSEAEFLKPVTTIDNLDWFLGSGGFSDFPFDLGLEITYSDPESPGDFYRWNFYSDGSFLNRTNLVLGDDRLLNGSQNKFKVTLPDLRRNSIVRVDQLSLTESAHNYLQQIRSQSQDLGKTFGVSPSPVRGNIISLSDPEEIVLGYFGVSSVQSEQFILTQ